MLTKSTIKQLYFSFVNSHLANIVWGSTYKTNLKCLNNKIKQSSRIICNKDRLEHSKPLLMSLDILDAYQLNIFLHLKFMFLIKEKTAPEIHTQKFNYISHAYPTNFSEKSFKTPKIKNNYKRFSISYRGPYLWNNEFTSEMKKIESKTTFCKTIRNYRMHDENTMKYF